MDITSDYGYIQVHGCIWNNRDLSYIMKEVIENHIHNNDRNMLPTDITFHECRFKDCIMNLVDDIVLDETSEELSGYFTNKLAIFNNSTILSIVIHYKWCDIYQSRWPNQFAKWVNILDCNGIQICRIALKNDIHKLKYTPQEDYPTILNHNLTQYKMIRSKVNNSVTIWHACKLEIPEDAVSLRTINGEVRSSAAHAASIAELFTSNSAEYIDDNKIVVSEDGSFRYGIVHRNFLNNGYMPYSFDMITKPTKEINVNSYDSNGPGIYSVGSIEECLRFLDMYTTQSPTFMIHSPKRNNRYITISEYLKEKLTKSLNF